MKHGYSDTPLFWVWWGMRQRCENPKSESYHLYGGRGISVCHRWTEFSNFLADMGSRPGDNYSIERIDGDGNYAPSNCKWATDHEQSRNTRRNVRITINGQTKILKDWAKERGLSYTTVRHRMSAGLDPIVALSIPSGLFTQARSGMKGVYVHHGRPKPFQAKITLRGGRQKSLGYFFSKDEAHAAYRAAAGL